MDRDHWDELFDEVYPRTYPARLDPEESAGEAQAAAELAGLAPPAEILDAPGGFGRHARPLAEAGYRVTVVDRSPVQLEEGRRLAGESEWPKWVQADFRDLPFEDESFDAVLNLFTSIGYRGEDADREMLTEFRRVLRPGGALVVETLHRDRLMAIFRERDWEPLDGEAAFLEDRRFHPVRGEIETEHILVADGERRSITFRLRVYTATELVRILTDVGFREIECFGGYEAQELTRETRLVVRARRAQS
jgi:ubiquinone/menaquinone biosynthesis C-methylase UbiE